MNEERKAIAHLRVSTAEQALNEFSIETQRHER